MAIYKIKIEADASWFSVTIANQAFWVKPENQTLSLLAKNRTLTAFRYGDKEVFAELSNDAANNIELEFFVETDESELKFTADSGGNFSIISEVDRFETSPTLPAEGTLRLS
jgi:hypothetical protein